MPADENCRAWRPTRWAQSLRGNASSAGSPIWNGLGWPASIASRQVDGRGLAATLTNEGAARSGETMVAAGPRLTTWPSPANIAYAAHRSARGGELFGETAA
jgi:hypothetical protein